MKHFGKPHRPGRSSRLPHAVTPARSPLGQVDAMVKRVQSRRLNRQFRKARVHNEHTPADGSRNRIELCRTLHMNPFAGMGGTINNIDLQSMYSGQTTVRH